LRLVFFLKFGSELGKEREKKVIIERQLTTFNWGMTQFISPIKVRLSSVARCMGSKDDENEAKLFSPFSQGIQLQSGSQVKSIAYGY